ncbi:hypothetical protein Psal006b_02527 [Piscirickettsia salmonis]|uniref:Uncharacterized protein n=1 Tax=Piscirickettsia salmonis TaxID=1238 RepID=A0A1L6T9M2_PISSA|nr:hypothetical protein [Piscirickettsia salmonis]AKP73190.1 hypothetical protein PSLF89_1207 [Piscirickettsia salmonis LF-89 = ATCC VR-1361]ALB21870.1 hypothetical protein KU39_686 [Piscirickettsia salmonis]ALY02047.1 hypothetical protein AWE47_03465 [Piscirickettsia salmonis]AMA41557.1 hypothetical protein AWJ11_03465 [Piscirickettsia salmonis]AOS34043.1 hypothetical protein AVM72_00700 [Piscirickettsia salmonis]
MKATNYFADSQLSLGALGVMTYIHQHTKNSLSLSVDVEELAKGINTTDKSLIRDALKELTDAGYLPA